MNDVAEVKFLLDAVSPYQARLSCRFGWHHWGPWQQIEPQWFWRGDEYLLCPTQQRVCFGCGKLKTKRIGRGVIGFPSDGDDDDDEEEVVEPPPLEAR